MEKATMIKFNVQGMTCGGCARAVTNAVQQADPAASVDVDLAGKTVSVESSADPARLKAAIEEAGYTVAA
jgi:copper chaperone